MGKPNAKKVLIDKLEAERGFVAKELWKKSIEELRQIEAEGIGADLLGPSDPEVATVPQDNGRTKSGDSVSVNVQAAPEIGRKKIGNCPTSGMPVYE